MSARSEVAERIAAKIREFKLTNPFGGDVSKSDRYYGILFAIPRYTDGLVRVYGPKWILVESVGPISDGKLIFESEQHAIDYLRAKFVEHDQDKADAIPTKPMEVRK